MFLYVFGMCLVCVWYVSGVSLVCFGTLLLCVLKGVCVLICVGMCLLRFWYVVGIFDMCLMFWYVVNMLWV